VHAAAIAPGLLLPRVRAAHLGPTGPADSDENWDLN
jgi:hypothetical protein